MKIETQLQDDHQVKLTVEVENERMEKAMQRAARKLAQRVKIPGFRPGKAPYAVIVRQIGEDAIKEEALEILVNDIYPEAIDQSGVKPYGPGSLENVANLEPPVLEFVVPLEAEIQLGEYQAINRAYEPKLVTEKDVEEVLDNLRERQAILEPVDRPAEEGDMVTIRLSAIRKQLEEGEDATLVQERSFPVLIRPDEEAAVESDEENATPEWPFPSFSRELIGLSPQDEKTINYTFPEDSEYETLRGAESEFHLTVEEVKSRILPELNDEFALSLGEFETMDALRAQIRENIQQQNENEYNKTYDQELMEEVIEGATIKYPPQMLEREVDNVVNNLKHRLEQQNLDMDLYLKTRQIQMEDLRQEALPVAEEQLKRSLVLMEVARVENITVDQEELQTATMQTMSSLSQSLPEKEARRLSDRQVFSNLVTSIMAEMLTERAMKRLRDIASGRAPVMESGEAEATEEGSATADAGNSEAAVGSLLEHSVTEESASEAQPDSENSQE